MTLKIGNRDARALWLSSQGLAPPPTGRTDVLDIVRKLGFVQLDTIQVVVRAHHHILWSRNHHYREPMLDRALADNRELFEHFTHDASVLPMEFFPYWRRQFGRLRDKREASKYFAAVPDAQAREEIKARIVQEGPLSTHAFDTRVSGKGKMWARPPHKLALDFMWYAGELATSHRINFNKYYDLTDRVIPGHVLEQVHADETQIDWLCRSALDRLGFGTPGEIQRFWDATDAREVREWLDRSHAGAVPVEVQAADGSWSKAFAPPDIADRLAENISPTSRLRILNPFDPVIRDRARLKRLFGFEYRVEMFVPAAKRQWGYYVYPLLERDRFVGRLEAKADRAKGVLNVLNFWVEADVKWTDARASKLDAELDRFAKLAGIRDVNWICSRKA